MKKPAKNHRKNTKTEFLAKEKHINHLYDSIIKGGKFKSNQVKSIANGQLMQL